MPDPNWTPGSWTKAASCDAASLVSFAGMIRFRFKGSSSRAHRNLSPPRRTPLRATHSKSRCPSGCKQKFGRAGCFSRVELPEPRNTGHPGKSRALWSKVFRCQAGRLPTHVCMGSAHSVLFRQCKGDVRVPRFSAHLSTTRRYDDVLTAPHGIGGGGCVSAGGKRGLPEQVARPAIKRTELLVL